MAAADTAKLVAQLTLDAKGFNAGIKSATSGLGRMESTLSSVGKQAQRGVQNFAKNAALISAGVVGALATQVVAGVRSLEDLQTAMNATEGVIKSTGGAAGVTAQQVRDLANALEDTTTVDDKTIQQGENLLLTFTNIGSKVFPQATKATVDLAVAMNNGSAEGADLSASAIQIGKALNDPIKGVTALTKVGVSFTKQQKEQIKALQESGDTVGAQTIILKELEKEFGQAGKAAGTGFGADMRRAQDAIEGAQQALATAFLPTISKVSTKLTAFLNQKGTQANIAKLGRELADAFDDILGIVEKIPFGAIGESLKIAGIGAKTVLNAFVSLPPWVQQAVITGWGLNKLTGGALGGIVGELGKGLIKGVLGMNAGVVNINAGVVNGGGGIPGGKPGSPTPTPVSGVASVLKDAVEGVSKLIIPAVVGGIVAEGIVATIDPADVAKIQAGAKPLANRDPRRFDPQGRVIANFQDELKGPVADTAAGVNKLVGKFDVLGAAFGGLSQDERDARAAQLEAQKQGAADVASAIRPVTPAVDLVRQSISSAAATASASALQASATQQAAAFAIRDRVSAGTSVTTAAINAANAAIHATTNAAHAAGQQTAAAIRDKKLSVTTNLTVNTKVSVRDQITALTKHKQTHQLAS